MFIYKVITSILHTIAVIFSLLVATLMLVQGASIGKLSDELCPQMCPFIYRPVCDSEGKTHGESPASPVKLSTLAAS